MVSRKLDSLLKFERDRPRPSEAEARVRLLDVQMVWDVVIAARERQRGARRRAAEKHEVAPATITAAVARLEDAMGVRLFQRDAPDGDTLTAAGRAFSESGEDFLRSYQILRKILQEASRT